MPEDVSCSRFSRPGISRLGSSRPVPGLSTNCCARSTGQEERRCYRILLHTFIQSCFFFLYISLVYISLVYISPLFISPLFISPLFLYLPCFYISPCLYLPCFYISLVFISPLFIYLPCFYISPEPWASHSFILSVPIHAQQATPPHQACSFS